MPIDYGRLRNVTAREIISALNRDGSVWDRGNGSYQIYYNPDGRPVHNLNELAVEPSLKWLIINITHD